MPLPLSAMQLRNGRLPRQLRYNNTPHETRQTSHLPGSPSSNSSEVKSRSQWNTYGSRTWKKFKMQGRPSAGNRYDYSITVTQTLEVKHRVNSHWLRV